LKQLEVDGEGDDKFVETSRELLLLKLEEAIEAYSLRKLLKLKAFESIEAFSLQKLLKLKACGSF
jgi:hypothetical protein